MKKPIIHFAHANGFPAKTYNKVFKQLENKFEIKYLEHHGHNPKYPVATNWHSLKEELHDEIKKNYREPIVGVGHSLGGVLHLMLASEKPELYKSLVLLDAMVISPLSSFVIKKMRHTSLYDKYSPARVTKKRRNHFETVEEALEHYRRKKKFANFDEGVLRDYVTHGLVKNEKGFELFIKPHIEAEIYRSIPDFLPNLKGKIKTPTIYLGGKKSLEARLARIGFMKRKFQFEYRFIDGTHLFPFEKPTETGKIIRNFLSK